MANLLNKDFSISHIGLNISRSKVAKNPQLKTSFNVGDLVPIYLDEVLPGSTFQLDTAYVARMSTPIKPTMDNLFMDISYFFVPNRLVWEHWEEFQGANKTGYWTQPIDYEVPQLQVPLTSGSGSEGTFGWLPKSLADYFGVPIEPVSTANNTIIDYYISALPFRAYALIWNEFYRDENLQDPCHIYLDDTTRRGSALSYSTNPGVNYVTTTELGGSLCRVCKFHDYFTSALPEPQKGGAVELPLGDYAPILQTGDSLYLKGIYSGDQYSVYGLGDGSSSSVDIMAKKYSGAAYNGEDRLLYDERSGLVADLSQATAANINQLRMAFALQQVLERDSRFGSRYTEILSAHFGVQNPDSRLQRPEYLGGKRIPLYINQVLQTSASKEGETPQGNTAGFSFNADGSSANFTKSFTEHGMIIGLACIRAEHTYQQGLAKFWTKKRRFDFYMPEFAHIGEQPIYNREIYLQGTAEDDDVFGYQEAWAEYRQKPSLVTGEMRSSYPQSLDVWHYADDYSSLPVLGAQWIQEPTTNIDRTLVVTSQVSDQFICDFSFDVKVTLPMPVYSTPGLKTL